MTFTVSNRESILFKPQTMTQGSSLSREQAIYRRSSKAFTPFVLTNTPVYRTAARLQGDSYIAHRCASTDRSASSVLARKRARAVGSSQQTPSKPGLYATSSPSFVRTTLNGVRNIGGTAPPKTRGFMR